MVCLRNIRRPINTLHEGDDDDDDNVTLIVSPISSLAVTLFKRLNEPKHFIVIIITNLTSVAKACILASQPIYQDVHHVSSNKPVICPNMPLNGRSL
jgi:hypothetical protein